MHTINFAIAFFALFAATVTDIRKREVPDWLSYSFIAAALAVASAQSIMYEDYHFILNSLSGMAIFFILAIIFYYGKLFAGGDAKLLIGIGAALGADINFLANTVIIGGVYGIIYSLALAFMNFESVRKEIRKIKVPYLIFVLVSALFFAAALALGMIMFYFLAVLSILSPLILVFTLAVEKAALIKTVSPEKLTEGDWLAKDVVIKGKTIKADFEGLSKKDILMIKKARLKVKIKYGLPFVPVFLIAFLAELILGNLFFLMLGI